MNNTDKQPYRFPYRVYYADTDAGGVVYNGTYLRLFEVARNELCRAHGILLPEYIEKGIVFVVRSASLQYLLPAMFDDLLEIEVVGERDRASAIMFHYRVLVQERGGKPHTAPDRAVATGSTQVVCCRVGPETQSIRPIRIPDPFLELF